MDEGLYVVLFWIVVIALTVAWAWGARPKETPRGNYHPSRSASLPADKDPMMLVLLNALFYVMMEENLEFHIKRSATEELPPDIRGQSIATELFFEEYGPLIEKDRGYLVIPIIGFLAFRAVTSTDKHDRLISDLTGGIPYEEKVRILKEHVRIYRGLFKILSQSSSFSLFSLEVSLSGMTSRSEPDHSFPSFARRSTRNFLKKCLKEARSPSPLTVSDFWALYICFADITLAATNGKPHRIGLYSPGTLYFLLAQMILTREEEGLTDEECLSRFDPESPSFVY